MGAMQKDVPEIAAMTVSLLECLREHERVFVFNMMDDHYCRTCGRKRIPKGKACEDCWEQKT